MPGRSCKETDNLVHQYLINNGPRRGKGHMRLKHIRGVGYPRLEFDLVLQAKRSFRLDAIKRDFNKGKLSLEQSSKRIFPLLVLIGSRHGIRRVKGNESYIRSLYRSRWSIEIAFCEMNRLGITTHYRHRDGRLAVMGAKILVYNMWQVQRYLLRRFDPSSRPLELVEFLGRTCWQRDLTYAINVGIVRSLEA